MDDHAPTERRVADLLARMTLEEKVAMMSGAPRPGYTGYIPPNERLGIPALTMSDGPVGVKSGPQGQPAATLFPSPIAMAASWNPGLIERVGAALGLECKANGVHVLLAPCVNIARVPLGGRSFEGFGEDPHLASEMAVAYVRGVQRQGVAACVKHYAANNQEWQRLDGNSAVDERTLREVYLPAFRAAVEKAGARSVMGAYNKVNGTFACENKALLSDILRREWGFRGFVVSDWGATHSSGRAADAGLHVEMPCGAFFGPRLLDAVQRGDVAEEVIDDAVSRILGAMFAMGLFVGGPARKAGLNPARHREVALEAARQGIVLLKNDAGTLPLDLRKHGSIAVIGPYAATARALGGGSSHVSSVRSASPLEAIAVRAGDSVVVCYAHGCRPADDTWVTIDPSVLQPPDSTRLRCSAGGSGEARKRAGANDVGHAGGAPTRAHGLLAEYFTNTRLEGEPAAARVEEVIRPYGPLILGPGQGFSVRWTGMLTPPTTGLYEFAATSDDGMRLYLDGELLIDNWRDGGAPLVVREVELEGGRPYPIRLEYYCSGVSAETGGEPVARLGWKVPFDERSRSAIEAAAGIAKETDAAVVFVGDEESEGRDRMSLVLPGRQDDLIEAVAEANRNTIVVLCTGGPVVMDRWLHKVPAVVEAWYAGQEAGHAVAEVLFGDVSPSGRLPVTFPARWEDSPVSGDRRRYPGEDGTVEYSEGVFVGYRHFDKEELKPLFAFGHGLSYTTFVYEGLQIEPAEIRLCDLGPDDPQGAQPRASLSVRLSVRNAGARHGAEVVQLYVRDAEASVERPAKELKGFARVPLAPGEATVLAFSLGADSLAFYDPATKRWTIEPGRFEVLVGSSSRDIRLAGSFVVV